MTQKVITASEVISSPTLISAPTAGVLSKLQRIGATSNVTTQQQQIVIQNIKLQPQQSLQSSASVMQQIPIQFKSMQVMAGGNQSSSTNKSTENECVPSIVQNIISPSLQQRQQQVPNFGRIIKTVSPLKSIESGGTNIGQRIISTNSGNCQIVSLENLLQKQGGALRLRSCLPTIVKRATHPINSVTTTTIMVEPLSERATVVTATPQLINPNIITCAKTKSDVSTDNNKTVSPQLLNTFTANLGRVVATAGSTTAKIISKSGAAAGNVRVLSSGGQIGNNLNFVTLQGKQVMLAAAAPTKSINAAGIVTVKASGNSSQANVSLANANIIIGGQAIKLPQGRNVSKNHIKLFYLINVLYIFYHYGNNL